LSWGPVAPAHEPPSAHCRRLDAVAGAVAHFQRAMMKDVDQAAKAMRDEEMLAEIEDFIEGFNQPTYRGMRIEGSGFRSGQASTAGAGCRLPSSPTSTLARRLVIP